MFEIHDSKDGKFFVILNAANGETLMTSEIFESKQGAKTNIASTLKNVRRVPRFLSHLFIKDKTASAGSGKEQ